MTSTKAKILRAEAACLRMDALTAEKKAKRLEDEATTIEASLSKPRCELGEIRVSEVGQCVNFKDDAKDECVARFENSGNFALMCERGGVSVWMSKSQTWDLYKMLGRWLQTGKVALS